MHFDGAPAIRAELALDEAQMGMIFSAFTLTYGLFEIPSGWMADRFGARKGLLRIVIFWSLMTSATALVSWVRIAGGGSPAVRGG